MTGWVIWCIARAIESLICRLLDLSSDQIKESKKYFRRYEKMETQIGHVSRKVMKI